MDIMESLAEEVDHFVFDCGEDDLDQCQEEFYHTKQTDIGDLVESIRSCQASIAGRWQEETRPVPLQGTSALRNVPITQSMKSIGSSQPVVVQTSAGVGNSPGFMLLDPNSLRLVSCNNNLKVFTVTPTTAIASSSQTILTPSSLSSLQSPSAPQTQHTLPQQLTTPRFRPQIRALTPNALNTKVVNSSPMLVTSERSAAPVIGVLDKVSPSVVKSPTTYPIQIKVISPNKPCPAQYKVVAKPTFIHSGVTAVSQATSVPPLYVPLVSQGTSATQYVNVASQGKDIAQYASVAPQTKSVPHYTPALPKAANTNQYASVGSQATSVPHYAPVASQVKNATQHAPVVPQATTVNQYAPVVSQATSVAKFISLAQAASKTSVARPLSATSVKSITSSSCSSPVLSSLPLLPVTRDSPPIKSSKSNPSGVMIHSKQNIPVQAQRKPSPDPQPPSINLKQSSGKPGTSPEVHRGVETKVVANGVMPSIPSALVDLTAEDNNTNAPSKTGSGNIQPQNKNSKKNLVKEKTFPSLVVTARACMKVIPNSVATSERLQLDNQLRKILQMSPQMFTEHLLQQRLLRSEQHCKNHSVNLKLGVYSDSARFPHSGGYVWISECCNAGFCSVFAGSIFDKTLQPPSTILKLMYHWSCNTAVHNVLQWVKVDNFIVKTYYTFFRAVCTIAVQEKMGLLGGAFKNVQVGVISLGTSAGQGKKDVKVDILAALDTETIQLRLRALDNSALSQNDDFYEEKLRRILETLQEWVHPNSTIITDFAVDLSLCRQYGFGNVVVSGGKGSTTNNVEVVGYLKNWVPKMFHNTLNLLSIQIIQQFLDELVWREFWGPIPSRAYDSLLNHVSEITKLPGPDVITKLKKVASFPTKNWKSSVWKSSNNLTPNGSNSPEAQGTVPRDLVPTAMPLPLEKIQQPKEPFISLNSTSKLKSTLLSSPCQEIPASQELAVKKPGPTLPTKTYGVSSVFDSARTSLSTKEDTFEIDDFIALESYYYGYIDGLSKRQKYTGAFLAECTICKRDFLSSSSFTNHLIHHALNDNEAWVTDNLMSVCKVCLLPVNDISSHSMKKHPKPVSSIPTACKICNVDHKSDEKLFKHMSNVHCELDMPYSCEQCQFRTSVYDDAASHFKDFHDKDLCVQCPFCLKVIRFCTIGGFEITSNQYYFIQHIQKHNVSKLNRKCEKCMLSFTNMGILKSHQENFHCSGKYLISAVRYYKNSSKFIKMKRPKAKPLPPVTLHESSFHTLKGKVLASIFKLDPSLSNFNCAECDSPIVQNHFSVKMTCTKCPFQSHCANAIKEHSARTHLTLDILVSKLPQITGGNPLLKKALYCSNCTFSSLNGNRMATHIAQCIDSSVATTEKRKLSYLKIDEPSEVPRKHRKFI